MPVSGELSLYWNLLRDFRGTFNLLKWEDAWIGISGEFVRILRSRREEDLQEFRRVLAGNREELEASQGDTEETSYMSPEGSFIQRVISAYLALIESLPLSPESGGSEEIITALCERLSAEGLAYSGFRDDYQKLIVAVAALVLTGVRTNVPRGLARSAGTLGSLGSQLQESHARHVRNIEDDRHLTYRELVPHAVIVKAFPEIGEEYEIINGMGTVLSSLASALARPDTGSVLETGVTAEP